MKSKMKKQFESFTLFICHQRWVILSIVLVLVMALVTQIPKLKIDTSNEGLFHKDDPILKSYFDFRDQFGRDEMIVIAIEPTNIFNLAFLKKLEKLHDDLEENVPHLYDITSLINVRNTYGIEGRLVVDDLLEKMPDGSSMSMEKLKKHIMENLFYRNRLISENGNTTAIIIETDNYSSLNKKYDALQTLERNKSEDVKNTERNIYLTEKENSQTVSAVKSILAKYSSDDFKVFTAGSPVVRDAFKKSMKRDFKKFIGLSVLVIGVCLGVMFQRVSGVFLPLLVVLLSLISTLGIMGAFNIPISMPTMILPSFLLLIGVGDCVHLLTKFYQELQKTKDKKKSVIKALNHSGFPIIITSLTTMAGLFSFAFAKVAPLGHMGIYSGIGIFLAMIFSIILLPIFLLILPIKISANKHAKHKGPGAVEDIDRFQKILSYIAKFTIKYSKIIVIASAFIILIFIAGLIQVHFSHDVLSWLPNNSKVRKSTQKIDQVLKGSVTLEVILDTGQENGLYDAAILRKLEGLADEIGQIKQGNIFAGKIISIVDVLKEINKALNDSQSKFYSIPDNPKIIPHEFLLFENSGTDDLENVTDTRFSKARFTIKTPWADAFEYVPFMKEIEHRFKNTFGTKEARITVTGMMALLSEVFFASIHSAATSYCIAFAVISLMMIFLIGDLRTGLLCIVPNFAPIIITMGLMGWAGIYLDMFSMMVGSIAIGIVVDDTIHFVYNFRKYYDESGNVYHAIDQTFKTAGRALLITSSVLSIGFFIYLFSVTNNLFNFGFLTGITVMLALVSDFLLLPALLVLFTKPYNKDSLCISH